MRVLAMGDCVWEGRAEGGAEEVGGWLRLLAGWMVGYLLTPFLADDFDSN